MSCEPGEQGYIKRPFFVQGQRGDQKIFIDKFVVTDGVLKGRVLSFAKTTDWSNPVYLDITEDTTASTTDGTGESTGGNADSNKKLRTDKEERKRVSAEGHTGHSLRENQLSETKPKRLTAREFAHAVGAVEVPPVQPAPQAKRPPVPPPPSPAVSRTDKHVIGDRYLLAEQWRKVMGSVESPSGINLMDAEWTNPGRQDMERLLRSTSDSVETIIAAARWGIETSDYWFKATTKGVLRSFTDFVNAYAPISKQYHNYMAETRKGASA